MKDEIARAIAKDNAITIEAKVRSYSKRADGGINIGLMVHPHGIPEGMREIEIGDRFYIAMFQIDDNEQPAAKEVVKTTNSPSMAQPASATLPGRASPQKRLAQLAGMLAKTPLFHRWIEQTTDFGNVDEENAAQFIRNYCGVESRSELLPGEPAGTVFLQLYDKFKRWEAEDQYVEAS